MLPDRMVRAFDLVMRDPNGEVADAISAALRAFADGDDPLPRQTVEFDAGLAHTIYVDKGDFLRAFGIEPHP